jgi:hypothetical protein
MNYENREAILKGNRSLNTNYRPKTDTHLEGLLWSKPITYWDYIQTDAYWIYRLKEQHFLNGFYHVSSGEWIAVQNDFVGNESNFLLRKH